MKKNYIASIFAAVLCAAPVVNAQIKPASTEGDIIAVAAFPTPPEGFSPEKASDAELDYYGFPPRPDQNLQPDVYAAWQKAMRASKHRIAPKLVRTNRFHGPAQMTNAATSGAQNSKNWSGIVVSAGATYFNNTGTFHFISTELVVPVARQAFGACTGGWDNGVAWVGIDGAPTPGDPSPDVLQAGVSFDAYCNGYGANNGTNYLAWVEAYPDPIMQIANFPVSPGDDVSIMVWDTDAIHGSAYLVNYNNNQSVTVPITMPPGSSLTGNVAEWVVERPGFNGSYSTLTNYISTYFSNCFAVTRGGLTAASANIPVTFYPGPGNQLTMLDDNGQPISYPTLLGNNAIWFQNEGSSR